VRRTAQGLALLLLLATAGFPSPARAEVIRSFSSQIELASDASFEVTEKIRYDFESEQRRGIFREIPVSYGRGRAADYRIRVEVLSVTDAAGNPHPYKLLREGKNLRIRIGHPDVLLSGPHDYWIRYRVERGVLYFDDHDEIYWNATGNEWPVGIERSDASVILPSGAATSLVETACFTGRQGSVISDCETRSEPGAFAFRTARVLAAQEGLTVVVGLPKGTLHEPSATQKWLDRASDYVSLYTLVPLVVLGGMAQLWRKRGRDPRGGGSIPVMYEPPAGITPAEMGTLVDESVDMVDITSTILDLAVHGYLRIEELESTRFLFLSDKDYELVKLREPVDRRPFDRLLMSRLFSGAESIRISALKNDFYQHLPELRETLYGEVSRDQRFFPTSPAAVRKRWAFAGAALAVLGFLAIGFGISVAQAGPFLLAGLIVLVFSRYMPRRTAHGRKVYEQVLGFKEFVERVDADRLERLGGRTAERFEEVLPFAMVLGAADPWADAFAGIYSQPPDWYRGHHSGEFIPRVFVSDVGHSLDTMGQTMRSKPSQVGVGGSGSSGLGGGGFSGGGFGGGGGGSW